MEHEIESIRTLFLLISEKKFKHRNLTCEQERAAHAASSSSSFSSFCALFFFSFDFRAWNARRWAKLNKNGRKNKKNGKKLGELSKKKEGETEWSNEK